MAHIHILDSETIDKIAAGEVVERPASVVKELVENAIDAGADAVTVEIREGGIEFIRVTDNGCGLEKNQLRTAFLRHATSKIENAEDLARIFSLGFRGEALSSIAAVARVEVITKTSRDVTGSRILLEGGRETEFCEVGAPEGTTFLVRNLFFNTPVRRKFLKQPATEGGYVADLMEHLALSRPHISFRFTAGGQMKFHTSGNGDLREVIYRIYGRDVARELVPISVRQEGLSLEGYLGKPVQVRSNRNFEIYFINGRFIRSNVIAKALEEGYREYLMQHKFPFCVLHIAMDAGLVDVNVHPAKMDVRFSSAMEFSRFLTESVKQTLGCREMIPEAGLTSGKELREAKAAERRDRLRNPAPEPFERNRSGAYRLMEETRYQSEYPKEQEEAAQHMWCVGGKQGSGDSSETISGKAAVPEGEEEAFFTETSEIPEELEAKGVQPEPQPDRQTAEPEEHMFSVRGQTAGEAKQLDLFEEKILTRENRSRFRIIGQVFETYWIIEFQDQMLMIDQHAAHEKVNYERLMKQYREKKVLSQGLFPPVIVSLTGQEEAVLKENEDAFAMLGFEIESFGGSEYALRSVPVDLYGCREQEMFLEVLDRLLDGTGFGNLRIIEEKIASMSCKAAVKGKQRLSAAEAEALVDELLTLENPYNCPHGRPIIVSMNRTELEKKFKRIVS